MSTAWTLADLSAKMKQLDFCFLSTHSENGTIAGRPMSNNGDVEYRGHSYFFSFDSALTIRDIDRDPKVALSYQAGTSLLGRPGLMIAIEGEARIVRDKAAFRAHWVPDLERWFAEGVDTPGLVLIEVRATRIHYWDGEDQGEIEVV